MLINEFIVGTLKYVTGRNKPREAFFIMRIGMHGECDDILQNKEGQRR